MAYNVKGFKTFISQLEKLGDSAEPVCKMAVYDAAPIVLESIKAGIQSVVSSEATGDLAASVGISSIESAGGKVSVAVGVSGYDRKGVPNALKARVLESGTSTHPKKPFMRKAINRARNATKDAMSKRFDIEISKRIDAIQKGD